MGDRGLAMRRIALGCVLLAAAASLALGVGSAIAHAKDDFRDRDLFCYWMGPQLAWEGIDPYRETEWRAAMGTRPDGTFSGCWRHYPAPLWTAVIMLPIAALPLSVAATVWTALTIAATIGGLALIWLTFGGTARSAPVYALVVLLSQPFWELLSDGQLSGVLLLAAGALVWSMSRGRDRIGGIALAMLAMKPHLSLWLAAAILARALRDGRRALVAASLIAGTGLVAASLALRPSWPLDWAREVLVRRSEVVVVSSTAWGMAADALGDARWGALLVLGLVATLWALVRGVTLASAELAALALPVSLFAAPQAWSYDLLLLAVPWGAVLARAERAGRAAVPLRIGAVTCASVAPWALYAVAVERGMETWSALLPAATAMLLALALRSRLAPTCVAAHHGASRTMVERRSR